MEYWSSPLGLSIRRTESVAAGGALRQPEHILVVRRGDIQLQSIIIVYRRLGTGMVMSNYLHAFTGGLVLAIYYAKLFMHSTPKSDLPRRYSCLDSKAITTHLGIEKEEDAVLSRTCRSKVCDAEVWVCADQPPCSTARL